MSALSEFFDYVTTSANWWGDRGIIHRTGEQVEISALSIVVATAVAVAPALYLGHIRRGGVLANAVVNIGRAIPSFAILAFFFPLALRWGIGDLGFYPTLIAMVLLAIPPMFTNTYAGVAGVEPGVVESARAMGLRRREVLWRVETPIALPLLLTGVRIAAVQVVATATLGGFFGLNNLGRFIFEGFSQQDDGKLITGAVAVALLAIATEVGFSALERRTTPWAQLSRRRRVVRIDPTEDLVAPARVT
jgi:osmoprotectant transport system permease protein